MSKSVCLSRVTWSDKVSLVVRRPNRNGNDTVTLLLTTGCPAASIPPGHPVYLSMNGGAKAITESQLASLGIPVPDLNGGAIEVKSAGAGRGIWQRTVNQDPDTLEDSESTGLFAALNGTTVTV